MFQIIVLIDGNRQIMFFFFGKTFGSIQDLFYSSKDFVTLIIFI